MPEGARRVAAEWRWSVSPMFQHIVDALLAAQPTPRGWQIWERLVDEHGAKVSYATVRDYISRKRREASTTPERIQ